MEIGRTKNQNFCHDEVKIAHAYPADQVSKIRRILEELGLHAASPDEARTMLKLKGGSNVAF